MILNLAYLVMGITIGIIIRYEIDIKAKRKRVEQRAVCLKVTANEPKMKQYDEILNSMKKINESLASVHNYKEHKKEVH